LAHQFLICYNIEEQLFEFTPIHIHLFRPLNSDFFLHIQVIIIIFSRSFNNIFVSAKNQYILVGVYTPNQFTYYPI